LLKWLITQITSVVKINNMAFTITSPFQMANPKCDSLKKEKAKLEKEIAEIKAKALKEKKIGNWDGKSDRISQIEEQVVQNKCK